MTPDDVEIIEKTTPFKGYCRIEHYLFKHRLFEDGWSDVLSRELLERGHAAAVLLYDPDMDKLVMIEQFRIGVLAALSSPLVQDDLSPWELECVAGMIDEKDSGPEDVVRREAVEEAGCTVTDLLPIRHYFSSPGCSSESVYLYCGRTDATNAGGIHGLDHEHEDIRVFTVTPDEAFKLLDEGKITNSMTLIALQWFQINRDIVRDKWPAAG